MDNNYEKSLKRLEEIVALLEEGGQPLEKSLELFSEGTRLLDACSKQLDNAEQLIVKLSGDSNEQ